MSKALGIVAVVVLVVASVFAYQQGYFSVKIDTTAEEGSTQVYRSNSEGVSFAYPNNYALIERSDGFENVDIEIVILTPKDVEIPDMSEGPPGMSLVIVPNPEGLSLEEWVRTKSISNFNLSQSGALAEGRVGGEPALTYQHSGLYETDAVAVAHAGKVYLFAGSWITAEDPIRSDFQNLVESVTFE